MKTQNITTTLPFELIHFLSEVSEEMNVKKNKVIEDALLFWKKKWIQQKIRQSYEKAPQDLDWKQFSEEGLAETNFLFEQCQK